MSHSYKQFQIQDLRNQNNQRLLESLVGFLFALFAVALLPSLILQFFFDRTQLLEQPAVLEYLPVIAFVLPTLYFLYALLTNFARSKRIAQLHKELENMNDCCGHCHTDDAINSDELAELERMVDEVLDQNDVDKTTTTKAAPKRTTKKTTRKKAK